MLFADSLLEGLLSEGERTIQGLEIESYVNAANSADKGAFNFGVYRTNFVMDTYALKFTDLSYFSGHPSASRPYNLYDDAYDDISPCFKEAVVIQHILGLKGLAPRLHGVVVNTNHIQGLTDQLKILDLGVTFDNRISSECAVLIMDYVDSAWNFTKREMPPSDFGSCPLHIVGRMVRSIKSYEAALNKFEFFADDTQYFIDRNWNVFLGDIEAYRFNPTRKNNFDQDIEKLIKLWEKHSGKQYTLALP